MKLRHFHAGKVDHLGGALNLLLEVIHFAVYFCQARSTNVRRPGLAALCERQATAGQVQAVVNIPSLEQSVHHRVVGQIRYAAELKRLGPEDKRCPVRHEHVVLKLKLTGIDSARQVQGQLEDKRKHNCTLQLSEQVHKRYLVSL